jgi:2,5-diketo-D-gluconate reductase A
LNIVVLPKTEKIERLKENIDFFDFKLSEEEI